MQKPEELRGGECASIPPGETDWGKAWAEAQSRSPLKAGEKYPAGWETFWNLYAPQYLKDIISGEPCYRNVVSFLRREGILPPGGRAIDVGCGPGPYAWLFAEEAEKVTALDSSAGVLAVLRDEVAARGLTNVDVVHSTWEDYSSPEPFDLVFASYSPAVNDEKGLLRMEALSSGSCCYVTAGAPSSGGLFYELSEALYGKRPPAKRKLVLYPFNLLFSMGRKPGVRMFDINLTMAMPSEYLVEIANVYMSIFTDMDSAKRKKIRDYVMANSSGGVYRRETSGVSAVIYWRAPGARR